MISTRAHRPINPAPVMPEDTPPPRPTRRKAKILCVDDEEQVLNGLEMLLGRRYNILTATGGEIALKMLEEHPDVETIISDMRMPGMDGAAFLRAARDVTPDATRILLTGQAELASAIAAINEGQIFRFLTKPCPPSDLQIAIEAAVKQYRLVVSERELLEGTLQGSIRAMIEVLSMTNPLAFGRGTRVQSEAMLLAKKLDMGAPWQLNVAAMLMEIGSITLPDPVLEKLHNGRELDEHDKVVVERAYGVTEKLLANIPRLEVVRTIVSLVNRRVLLRDFILSEEQLELSQTLARVLRAAVEYDQLEAQGMTPRLAVETMDARGTYTDVVIEALTAMHTTDGIRGRLAELAPSSLRVGMVLADDLRMSTGAMLVPRGFTVSEGLLARLSHLAEGALRGKVRVYTEAPPDD